jgi:hypothetical protein
MTRETWRHIPGSARDVSDRGRVRAHYHDKQTSGRWVTRGPWVCALKKTGKGYLTIGFKINGRYVRRAVHRLVLEAFVGPCPAGCWARHRNGKQQDNRLRNLLWDTPANNQRDKLKHGTATRGERNGMATLTRRVVTAIRQAQGPYGLGAKLATRFGISRSQVSRIRLNQRWSTS